MNRKKVFVGCVLVMFGIGVNSCDSINKVTSKVTNSFSKKAPVAQPQVVLKSNTLNGKWRLNYITGPRITFDGLYPNTKPFMVFDTSKLQVTGGTGCNNFTGTFQRQGDSIHFSPLATTMMNCTDGGQGESVFVGTLDKVSHYRISGDTLWFRFKKIEAMRFVRDTTTNH